MAGPGPLGRLWRRLRPQRRIALTREGRYFVAITIGIGLAAINTGNNLLYLLLGWLLSLIIASGAMSNASLRGLVVRRRAPGRVFANRPFLMEVTVRNQKHRHASYSVEVEDVVAGQLLDKRCYFLKIPPERQQHTSYRHTLSRRGLYSFGGFRISTRFPFGLFVKRRRLAAEDRLLVYPAVQPMPMPPPRARYLGEVVSNRLGRRGEFHGLREYRDGDDRRSIHWRSTARSGRLLVREFEEESQRRVTIAVDNALPEDCDDEHAEALEAAISLAASLASTYARNGYGIRLIARGCHLPFSSGREQLERVLKHLALLDTVSGDVAFTAPIDPTGESVLVVPRGVERDDRPGGAGHVLEAG